MGSDPAPFFDNFFLAHKKADWVKAQRKFRTNNVRKINNSFWFIDDLLSLNDDSIFEKHYKDIYPTELELKKENNSNSLKMENFILNHLTNEGTLASIL